MTNVVLWQVVCRESSRFLPIMLIIMKDLSSDGSDLMKFVDVPSFQKDDHDGFIQKLDGSVMMIWKIVITFLLSQNKWIQIHGVASLVTNPYNSIWYLVYAIINNTVESL